MSDNIPGVVFFGSGPVAAKSLELLSANFNIETIITKPSTIHDMKSKNGTVPVFAVRDKQELDLLFRNTKFKSPLAILIDFGIIISRGVIDYFPLGIINSHFSLLPEWRGADPITFAILSGQTQTGVSLMLLDEHMDEGLLLAQSVCDISKDETTPSLTSKLIQISDSMLKAVVPLYLRHEVTPISQDQVNIAGNKIPSYSRRLTKDDSIIDWTKSATQLEREIRAYSEWPRSHTTLANREVIIIIATANDMAGKPGIVSVNNKQLFVHCGQGSLEIKRLKPAGKAEMPIEAFLAGYQKFL
jgi:methionyl-tRNA formyltransferase